MKIKVLRDTALSVINTIASDLITLKGDMETTRQSMVNAGDYATALTGIAPENIYSENETLNPASPDGTQAVKWSPSGVLQRFKKVAGQWIQYPSTSLLSHLGLQRRQGLSLLDYEHLKAGDDWTPALTKLVADAVPGSTITLPPGEYTVRSTWVINKPVNVQAKGAWLMARGTNFTGTSLDDVRPVIDVATYVGNGSFGDNTDPAYGKNTVSGYFPHVYYRDNMHISLMDWSVCIRIINLYYGNITFGDVIGTHIGILFDAKKTSGVHGISHGVYTLGAFHCVKGIYLNARGDTPTGGWISTNKFIKGAFSSPDFLKNNPLTPEEITQINNGDYSYRGRVIPEDHVGITIKGGPSGLGWCYNNLFFSPYIEGANVYGFEGFGSMQKNGINFENVGWCEMPENERRGLQYWVRLFPDASGSQQGMEFSGGVPSDRVYFGTSAFTRTSTQGYPIGEEDSFNGIARIRTLDGKATATLNKDWYPDNFDALGFATIYYNGNPIAIDVRQARRFVIVVPDNTTLTAGKVTFTNVPEKIDVVIEVKFVQGVGSVIAPNWSNPVVKYNGFPRPYSRNYGQDAYKIIIKRELGYIVTDYVTNNDEGVRYGFSLPADASWSQEFGIPYFHMGENRLYVTKDAHFVPATPQATTAQPGTVKQATAVADTLDVSDVGVQLNKLLANLRAAGIIST